MTIYDAKHNGLTIEIREQQAPVVGEVRWGRME